jgi:hypothetical protein
MHGALLLEIAVRPCLAQRRLTGYERYVLSPQRQMLTRTKARRDEQTSCLPVRTAVATRAQVQGLPSNFGAWPTTVERGSRPKVLMDTLVKVWCAAEDLETVLTLWWLRCVLWLRCVNGRTYTQTHTNTPMHTYTHEPPLARSSK